MLQPSFSSAQGYPQQHRKTSSGIGSELVEHGLTIGIMFLFPTTCVPMRIRKAISPGELAADLR